jgi:ribulose 1,5-bisphosphate synthetase/thiazole synthase
MKNDPHSHGLWEHSAPLAPSTMRLSGDLRADVVVIGAGFTGLSAALHLALVARAATSVSSMQACG